MDRLMLKLEYAQYAEDVMLDGEEPLSLEEWALKELEVARGQVATLKSQNANLLYLEVLVKSSVGGEENFATFLRDALRDYENKRRDKHIWLERQIRDKADQEYALKEALTIQDLPISVPPNQAEFLEVKVTPKPEFLKRRMLYLDYRAKNPPEASTLSFQEWLEQNDESL